MGVHLWLFIGIATVVIIVPGPDTALVTKNAVLHGRRAALGTAFGVNAGIAVWTLAAALGVASVVRASDVAFNALKLIGAAYLIWLGVQALLAAQRGGSHLGAGRSMLVPSLVLGVVFLMMTLAWLVGYALVAVRASEALRRRRVAAAIDRLSGAILIGFGIRLALERR